MKQFLRITIRFLVPEPTFHGQRDGGELEWPPSPLRLFQALVDAAASRWQRQQFVGTAQPLLQWVERLSQPEIVAPAQMVGTPFRIAVPNNDLDVWAGPISKGNEPKKQPNELKTMKPIHSVHLVGDVLHYLFALPDGLCPHLEILRTTARSITHLGRGIDMAVGDAAVLDAQQVARLDGIRWHPSAVGGIPLRVPKAGTLNDLTRKHADFLNRITDDGFRPVSPLRIFEIVFYRRDTDPLPRPHVVFRILDENDAPVAYSHAKLIHIAGMVRHLSIEAMKRNPPRVDDPATWVEHYVAGHQNPADKAVDLPHRQLSFIPLPSTGHPHTDPGVRRVMIVAPVGDDDILEHLARQLDGLELKPERQGDLRGPVFLERARRDNIAHYYTRPSVRWASFTPVILPGHDDHKPAKTQKLILKALAQSGIEQPCEFEWSAFSHFPKSYSAHKYVRDESARDGKRPAGYIRPDHLLDQTAVHLTLRFGRREDPNDPNSRWIPAEYPIPGPLTIGAGRHCGFGLMAAIDGQKVVAT